MVSALSSASKTPRSSVGAGGRFALQAAVPRGRAPQSFGRPRLGTAYLVAETHYPGRRQRKAARSEEHTSELQSLMRISYAVFCLKKKTNQQKELDTLLELK